MSAAPASELPAPERVNELYARLKHDAEAAGYYLNPDVEFTLGLCRGLLVNEGRYGYPSCPCRLASGVEAQDRDIVCPCDYRDPDLDEYGACYCALYVSPEIARGEAEAQPVPERRPPGGPLAAAAAQGGAVAPAAAGHAPGAVAASAAAGPAHDLPEPATVRAQVHFDLPYPVWRCKVCGYLAARDQPPAICPICKAKRDRFERFL